MAHIPERRKTERRKGDEAVRRSEEKYRTILENIEEGYYEEDLAGNFTFFNDSMCRIYGYSREELMGMNYRKYTDKETAKKLFQVFNEIYKTGGTNKVYDYEVIRKDGTKRYIEASASIKKDSLDKPIGFRGIVRDITEHKISEETLRQSEEKYRTIIENIEDGYFEIDLAGNFTFVNDAQCKNTGTPREQLIGKNNRDYTSEEEAKRLYQIYSRIYRTGEPVKGYAFEFTRRDGAKAFHEVSVSLIRDSKGNPIGFRGIARDVTERKQAEEALRQSVEKYRNILESIQEGYFEIDLLGNYTFVNEANCRFLGYSKEELVGMNYRQHMDEETAKKVYQPYHDLYLTGQPIESLEVESFRKDGTKVIYETSVSLIRDSKGEPIGYRGVSRDITERKKMEEALRRSEEKYRTILESIDDGYYEVDLAGNYTFANDAEGRNLGYTKEKLIGMNNRQYQDETNAQKTYQAFREVYRTGEPIKVLEMEVIRRDRTKGFNEISISLIRDEKGKPVGFRGITRDTTKRRQMEDAMRQSEERYRTILEDIEEGYFEADLAGNATYFNDSICRIFGYPREEFMRMNYKQYTDKENGEKCFQIYNKIYKTGKSDMVYDYEIIRKDGTKRYIESSVSLQKDSSGNPIGFRGVSRDITERKIAEDVLRKNQEELIKMNREMEEGRKNIQITLERLGKAYEDLKASQAKMLQQGKMASIGQLAAGVAHEINNPMAFIASNLGTLNKYIQRLKEFIQAQSEAIKSLKATEIKKLERKRKELKLDYTMDDIDLLVKESLEGSERVQQIVRGLNRFSRVDDEEYKDANINECIESSINIVWNELKLKAALQKDYGNLPHTKCYPLKLSQVFINFLINAIHAIEKKGTIKIKTWQKDEAIWITISDTGCGISKENQSKIFEPFFTTKEAGRGTGLGLSVSYDIIQRHKGEISFKSEKGKGTTFTIRIPIV